MIDLTKIDAAPTCRISLKRERYPYFLPLPVSGEGTGDIESISSYLSRQAEQISEGAFGYLTRLQASMLPDGSVKPLHPRYSHTLNGYNLLAVRAAQSVSMASEGKIDGRFLTLTPIEFLCDYHAHGVLRESMVWCPLCWHEDNEKGRSPYQRLYWTLQQTRVCAIHRIKLQDSCTVCGAEKNIFGWFPRLHVCDKCGRVLFHDKPSSQYENFTSHEQWLSHAVYALIHKVTKNRILITSDVVSKALTRILETQKITVLEFSKLVQCDTRMLRRLIDKEKRPYLPSILDICYRLDIPPDKLFFDRDILTCSENWKTHPREKYIDMSKLTKRKRTDLLKALQSALTTSATIPIRVSHIASRFNIRTSTIRYNFPEEYSILTARRSAWEKTVWRNQHQARLEKLVEGIFSLARVGVYPSERKLRDLNYMLPSDLRREDVKHLLGAFQDVYKSLWPGGE